MTDKVRAILSGADFEYQITTYPWARAMDRALNNKNVLIYPIYRTPQRSDKFHWFCPLYPKTPVYVFTLSDRHSDIADIDDLRSLVTGVTRNDNSHTVLHKHGLLEGTHLDVVGDPMQNIINLVEGRIDAIVQTQESLVFRATRMALSPSMFKGRFQLHPEQDNEHCMALSKQSNVIAVKALRIAFDNWQKQPQ